MHIYDDLKSRGLIYQVIDEEKLKEKLNQPTKLYCGFDPSAESLHIGNLLQIITLMRFQKAGHKPYALVGGATGLIGDPSGKSKERQLNEQETVENWAKKIKSQVQSVAGSDVEIVNNYDWLSKINTIEYLRDFGKNFNINEMLAKDSVKSRLETGISFTEFNYMILQSIDFYFLNKEHEVELQFGGSDQWGNITAGVDLIRKKAGKTAYALTAPLVTKADGTKFGKTESGTIWLDADKTTPYEFYQFWLNTSDNDVIKFLKLFTFLELNEIEKIEKSLKQEPEKRLAQQALAKHVTELVHGEKELQRAENITAILFSGNIADLTEDEIEQAFNKVPSYELSQPEFNLVDLLVEARIENSKRQAREDVQAGAIAINGEKSKDVQKEINKQDFLHNKYLIIKKGKKKYFLIKK